jgi:hypothetical protein
MCSLVATVSSISSSEGAYGTAQRRWRSFNKVRTNARTTATIGINLSLDSSSFPALLVALSARNAAFVAPVTAATTTTAHAAWSLTSSLVVYRSSYTDVKNAVDTKSPSAVSASAALFFRRLIFLSRAVSVRDQVLLSTLSGGKASTPQSARNVGSDHSIITTATVRAGVIDRAQTGEATTRCGMSPALWPRHKAMMSMLPSRRRKLVAGQHKDTPLVRHKKQTIKRALKRYTSQDSRRNPALALVTG